MPWTTPETFTAGQTLTAASMNAQSENDRVLRASTNIKVIRRVMANDNNFSNQTSYAQFPNATDRAAMEMTFVKELNDTSLILTVFATCNFTSGTTQAHAIGLQFGTGTVHDVAAFTFPTAVFRATLVGMRVVTGQAAGSITINPRFISGGASAVSFVALNDFVHYSVQEIRA